VIHACGILYLVESSLTRSRMGTFSSGAYRPLTSLICWTLGLQVLERNGGDDETRTRDLCRDSENVDRN
jgi:hypothetical protein